jgi:hypothetical protein
VPFDILIPSQLSSSKSGLLCYCSFDWKSVRITSRDKKTEESKTKKNKEKKLER